MPNLNMPEWASDKDWAAWRPCQSSGWVYRATKDVRLRPVCFQVHASGVMELTSDGNALGATMTFESAEAARVAAESFIDILEVRGA